MRTKHLFFAAALAASFSACTNDDIIEVQQQSTATVKRPTVENVQLNFVGEGVDSRLAFGTNGYAWEATDTIGALLMDSPLDLNAENWMDKYSWTTYINTSYPFTYSTENKTWSCPGKMLEGNYFFAFPWSSYDGGRTMKHSLLTQSQKGIGSDVVAKSLAENQLFIGYSQIKGGTAFDVLTDVEMTSVLGALQLRIKNAGDKTYHINKIVVSGTDVASELTFNPDVATYAGTDTEEGDMPANLDFAYGNSFNYANYVGNTEDALVYNITEDNAKYYNRADALRSVVSAAEGCRTVAYLNIEGTESERALASGKTAYALIMLNPLTDVSGVSVSMYTDEGVIELTSDLAGEYNLNDEQIEAILPGVSNTLVTEFEDNDLTSMEDGMYIYTEEDLALFVDWNKSGTTTMYATLKADIELTKEVFTAMKAATRVNWNLTNGLDDKQAKLTLASDLPANALDYEKLKLSDLDIVAEGTVDFTKKTTGKVTALTIAEGATMNVKVDVDGAEVVLPYINNKGTLNIAAVQVLGAENIYNDAGGVVNVAAGADVKGQADEDSGEDDNDGNDIMINGSLINNGVVNNAGYIEYIKNNAGAVMNLTGTAVAKNLTNATANATMKLKEGTVNAAAGTSVAGTNDGLITCADSTVSVSVSGDGKVALEVTGDIAKDAYKGMNINALIIKGATTFADSQDGVKHIITTDGSELKLGNAKFTLSLESLEVNGATKLTTVLSGDNKNNVSTKSLIIMKGATLTNNGIIDVATNFSNEEGKVINNQTANLPDGSQTGTWLYNAPGTYTEDAEDDVDLEYTSGTLKTLINNAYDSNDKVTLTISGQLDMSVKDNYEKDEVFERAEKVTLKANIINMKESYATTANKLIVEGNDVQISGTKNMTLITVDELEVKDGYKLTIENGYLQINVTAVKGKGCEGIDIADNSVNGIIIAYTADGEMLYWDNTSGVWSETDPRTVDNN